MGENSTRVEQITAALKGKYAIPAYTLGITPDRKPDLFDSKFGGVPYWDMAKEYPTDSRGKKMMLLAQLNFTKASLNDERLPGAGMLQFFITAYDDCFGMNFDDPQDLQKDFRVIFHETIDESITEEQVRALDIPIATELDTECSPVFREVAVEFYPTTASIGPDVCEFDEMLATVVKEITGEDMGGVSAYNYFNKEDYQYLYDNLDCTGHRVLGYPFFTQTDPRENMDMETARYYDTLLFQMDSEMADESDIVLWGDCGVANFFINSEALKRHDFSRVLYNWDCC